MNSDNGNNSRKLRLAYVAMLVILAGACMAAGWPMFGPFYQTMVGGILGAAAIYTGGNVTTKWVANQVDPQLQFPPAPTIQVNQPVVPVIPIEQHGFIHPEQEIQAG